jgi:serine/threonine-protein kinase RsbW
MHARSGPVREVSDPCKAPDEMWVSVTMPTVPESLCIVADVGMAVLKGFGVPCETAEETTQAVLEAMGNALRHGNRLDPGKVVRLRFEKTKGKLRVSVEDEGCAFRPRAEVCAPTDLLRESGRGLFIMEAYVDQVLFEHSPSGGTKVVLIKRIEEETEPGAHAEQCSREAGR